MVDAAFQKAVPLIEYAKGFEEATLERAFIDTFQEESDLMAVFPIRPAPGGKYKFSSTAALPDVKFRAYNEPGNTSHGRTQVHEEGVFLIDEYVKVDRAYLTTVGPQERSRQERMKAIALAQEFSRTLVYGDNSGDPREPNGFKARCGRVDTNLFHNSTASGGAALSLLTLDQAINAVNRPTHLLMPRKMKPFWQRAARDPALTNNAIMMNATDPLGRTVMQYQGLPILWGYEPDDSGELIDFNEVGAGGGAAQTASIYVLSLGDERVFGIESQPLAVTDEGQLQGQPLFSTHFKWDWGIVSAHPRSMARLTSVTAAAITAA